MQGISVVDFPTAHFPSQLRNNVGDFLQQCKITYIPFEIEKLEGLNYAGNTEMKFEYFDESLLLFLTYHIP